MDYRISANNEAEFRKIREAMDVFDNNYEVMYEGDKPRALIDVVSKTAIHILPSIETSGSKITDVVPSNRMLKNPKKLEGKLIKANQEYLVITIGDQKYMIDFENYKK